MLIFFISQFLNFSGEVYRVELDARNIGLGSSYYNVNSASSIFYNPFNINSIDESLFFGFGLLYEGISASAISYKFKNRPYGVGLYLVLTDNIELTSLPDTSRPPSSDNRPYVSSVENYIASALYFSIALKNFGVSAKLLYQGISKYMALGIGFDLSTNFKNFSIIFKDFVPSLLYWNSKSLEFIPPLIILSSSINYKNFLISSSFDFTTLESREFDRLISLNRFSIGFSIGLEYNLGIVSIRGGFKGARPSFGFGIKYKNYSIDYGSFYHRDLGLTHRTSLYVSF
ncbi:MAG: hypothetical protein N2504_06075 [candidate division WOR-3 bacterium]|nr:hypothetical protein [candidate division WOR-3 bacterium]MCX7948137.1 hypothetical protein [candidate division WOR-3 bacterium]MDW8151054.1 hypothetical protein [candidate division WOR-3 bacterium]